MQYYLHMKVGINSGLHLCRNIGPKGFNLRKRESETDGILIGVGKNGMQELVT